MDPSNNPLIFDVETSCEEISQFIENMRIKLGRDGILLGLSGGLDSAVTAYLTALGVQKENINLLYLPDRDSKKLHRKDAELISAELGISLQTIVISSIIEAIGVYDLLPIRFVPGYKLKEILVKFGKRIENIDEDRLLAARFSPKPNSLVAKGNAYGTIKHRIRMVMLYYHANINNLMVVGAANKTELLTGTFSQWGCDQCTDVMPVIHLYRTQLEKIAEYLQIPERIRAKPADPDIIAGIDNKEELLGSFATSDLILNGLENGIPEATLIEQYGEKEFNRINNLYSASKFMREAPYSLG